MVGDSTPKRGHFIYIYLPYLILPTSSNVINNTKYSPRYYSVSVSTATQRLHEVLSYLTRCATRGRGSCSAAVTCLNRRRRRRRDRPRPPTWRCPRPVSSIECLCGECVSSSQIGQLQDVPYVLIRAHRSSQGRLGSHINVTVVMMSSVAHGRALPPRAV